jgi:hypothetical protein
VPLLVVEVLLASGIVRAGGLNVAMRIGTDPDVIPSRWDGEGSDALELLPTPDRVVRRVQIAEAASVSYPPDPWAAAVNSS